MKKTIKLTEYLSKIIKEALNELDWKTYANAAKKAERKWLDADTSDDGVPHRIRYTKFDNAATDAFNKEYGYEDDDFSYEKGSGDSRTFTNKKRVGTYASPFGVNKRYWHDTYRNDGYPDYPMNDNAANALERGDNELSKYYNGNYEYVKGKGWMDKNLNEAITRAIRKVLR